MCGASSGVWGGAHGQDHRSNVGGVSQSGAPEEIQDSVSDSGVKGAAGINKAQVTQATIDRADEGEFERMYMAHETDEPTRDAFPNGWGDIGGDALD